MSWNYRVMRERQPDGTFWFAIHEVFYTDAKAVHPNGWSERGVGVGGETFKEITQDFEYFSRAFSRPILAVEANGDELYEIGYMGNKRNPKLVWKREAATSVDAGATPLVDGATESAHESSS